MLNFETYQKNEAIRSFSKLKEKKNKKFIDREDFPKIALKKEEESNNLLTLFWVELLFAVICLGIIWGIFEWLLQQ